MCLYSLPSSPGSSPLGRRSLLFSLFSPSPKALTSSLIFYDVEVLGHCDVTGELVAPVHYLRYLLRLAAPAPGGHLDHPYLVGLQTAQIPQGRILAEQGAQYTPPSTCVASNTGGTAVEARRASMPISPLRLSKFFVIAEMTSMVLTRSTGLAGPTSLSRFAKSTGCFSS